MRHQHRTERPLGVHRLRRSGISLAYAAFTLLGITAEGQHVDFDWAVRTGGSQDLVNQNDRTLGVITDTEGNIYDNGQFRGTVDFDPSSEAFNLTSSDVIDAYLRKLDENGGFVYAAAVPPNTSTAAAVRLVIDSAGTAYASGHFRGTVDFDPGTETAELTCDGDECLFLLQLDSFGEFGFVRSIGGLDASLFVADIGLDAFGRLLIIGGFNGTVDFDPGPGTVEVMSEADANNEADGFVLALDSFGDFVFVKRFNGPDSFVQPRALAIDQLGNIWITGTFTDTVDFDPGPGTVNLTASTVQSGFVVRLDTSGDFIFGTANGGAGIDTPEDIAVDSTGAIYTVGSYQATVDFDPGSGTAVRSSVDGQEDMYIEKLDAAGNFAFVITIGAAGTQTAQACAVGALDNLYVTGLFDNAVDFDPSLSSRILSGASHAKGFLAVLNPSGDLLSADAFAGTDRTWGTGVALGSTGAIVIAGNVQGTVDFDPGPDTFVLEAQGIGDGFVTTWLPSRRIVTVPTSGIVEEGDRIEMRGPIGSNYQWRRDGVDIVDDPPRVSGATTRILTINPVELSDSGVYRVEYDNGTKAITVSEPFVLEVLPIGSLPVSHLLTILCAAGGLALLGGCLLRSRR